MSFLYSRQIHALASLWRLFRGRKWNPSRKRLDSYDYCVEQHVVGSLLFTPLLLLLPTTSVFYMFFTILYTTISFICFMIEITISILRATPYAEVLLWLRFPSGVWIEIMPCQPTFSSSKHGLDQKITSDITNRDPETLVSLLHSNYATLGQVIAPSYRHLLQRTNLFSGMPSAYGVLSGQRIPTTVQVNLPPSLPWMCVSCREFWRLCLNAVLACRLSQ
ncbi:N-acetylglucosaminyl-phosphatidylinositol biosynthetic protein gpi1-like isoform X7 [Iris pallida]|uniref:N-acetylglucosaminyl-phosphatidylinositol biosynthetic protein gpi1-like isoform X7 n=1 Tax=Iris pallida TaxID=29817 RepID=A0AAX6DVW9_IRIPA|nr:N-acetylglucosaminyl-phosphatidylinositol biosynthetic protein gpi1-like isoform X7 [Iris pallida]